MINLPMRRSALCLLPLLLLGLVSAVSCSSIEQEGEASPGSEANSGNHLEQAASSAASPDAFDLKYAELRTQGKSHKAATELAKIYADGATDNGTPDGTQHTLDAAVILAKFSATDPHESKQREQAAEELKMRFESRDLDAGRALNLLGTITPEASIEDRRELATSLAELSRAANGNDRTTMEAGNGLIGLIVGNANDAERRIKAANELARRANGGGLDPDQTLELMSDIAPGVSADVINVINESAVDLTGEVIKQSNSDAYDEADVDAATEMIKRAFRGELDAEGVSDLLELEQ